MLFNAPWNNANELLECWEILQAFLSLADFFKIITFKNFVQERQESQTFCIKIGLTFCVRPKSRAWSGSILFAKVISRQQKLLLAGKELTLKVPPIICSRQFEILMRFSKIKNKAWYFMRIVCWQTILMKYHTLVFLKIRKDVAKFVVCCSRDQCFKG